MKYRLSLFLVLLVSGCASAPRLYVDRAEGFTPGQLQHVLVAVVTRVPGARKTLEQEFVDQWRVTKIKAEASWQALPSGFTLENGGLASFAKAKRFDHVLVCRLLSPKEAEAEPDDVQPSWKRDTASLFVEPEYDIHYEVTQVRTHIYQTATGRLQWSGTVQTQLTSDNVRQVAPSLAGAFVNGMSK